MAIDGPSLFARVAQAARYAVHGTAPDGWFGPGVPLTPQAPPEVRGRQFDYPFYTNMNYTPRSTEVVGFAALKQLARYPIVQMLIQRQIDKITALEWQVKSRKGEEVNDDAGMKAITSFLHSPDRVHDWGQWIAAVLDQKLVIDAVTIYGAPTRNGSLYALQIMDGAQFKPLVDLGGRTPVAPLPAYQQIIKGLPAVDYNAAELVYFPQRFRADKIYGYSQLEQARDLVDMGISRLRSQKGYFDHGNVGDGYFTTPTGWTPEAILGLEAKWNSWMQGDVALRRAAPIMPDGTNWHPTKVDLLDDHFDEWLIRLLCFPFGVSPQPFMKQTGMGKGSASSEHEAAEEGGVAPLMQYVTRLMSRLIAQFFNRPDLEFAFADDREFDPKTAAEIDDINIKNGTRTINEARDARGERPIDGGDVAMIYLTNGPMLVADAANPPDPEESIALVAATAAASAPPPAAPPEPKALPAPKAAMAKAADAMARNHLAIVMASYLKAKGAEIADALAPQLGKAAGPASEDYSGRVQESFDSIDWSWDDLPELTSPIIAGVAVAAGANSVSELGLFDADTLKRVSARATAFAQDRAAEMVGMKYVDGALVANPDAQWVISDTTRDMLRKAVTKAMDEGQSNQQLSKTIRENDAFSKTRADTIARTETGMADVRGAAAGWIESGVVGGAEFNANPECCEECQGVDGDIVEFDGLEDLELPHPACRCSWSPLLMEDIPGAEAATE
jgi:hypothetical protein